MGVPKLTKCKKCGKVAGLIRPASCESGIYHCLSCNNSFHKIF